MSPASVAPADGSFQGAGRKPAPASYLPVEFAPLRRKGLRAVKSPSFTARFSINLLALVGLHGDADRVILKESRPP